MKRRYRQQQKMPNFRLPRTQNQNALQCDHSKVSNIAQRDFDKINLKFKIPAAYGVLESSQVLPIKFF